MLTKCNFFFVYWILELMMTCNKTGKGKQYGSRIVPGKKYILSGGRHLIYLAAATYYVAAAT